MQDKEAIKYIQELSDANGVSGFEDEVVELVRERTQTLGKQQTDAIKNLYIYRNENTHNKPLIQLDAHSDEVGFMIQAIREDGMLRFVTLGGWIPNNITAQKVRVRNSEGNYVSGIVSSKPPHFMSKQERTQAVEIEGLFIDVGASSKKEIEDVYKIRVGAPVVPAVESEFDTANGLFLGKAFDCRVGCACMVDVLDELAGDELTCDVVATLTSQEEVGERGAIVASQKVKADLAIVFEGCPADDTAVENYMVQSALGKGPMLRHFDISMITNPEFQQYAEKIAEEVGISLQLSVRGGGGTNGAAINQVQGAPAIVIGIPVRYAHTHHCFIQWEDYAAAKKLALAIIRSLDKQTLRYLMNPLNK